jgi:ATP-dependent DNA helicase RecG
MFIITLKRSFDFDNWVNSWVNNLSEKQLIILTAIPRNNKIKKSEIHQLVDFMTNAFGDNINVLKKEGLLERESSKRGAWEIHYINPKIVKKVGE